MRESNPRAHSERPSESALVPKHATSLRRDHSAFAQPASWISVSSHGAAVVLATSCLLSQFACHGSGFGRTPASPVTGEVVTKTDAEDDPDVLSPPTISVQALECASVVFVEGFCPTAMVDVFSSERRPPVDPSQRTRIGGGPAATPTGQSFAVRPELAPGTFITASQTVDGKTSLPSVAVEVQGLKDVYPDGLPAPAFRDLPLYECGILTSMRPLPPGGDLFVVGREPAGDTGWTELGKVNGVGEGQQVGIRPPFILGQGVLGRSELCDEAASSEIQWVERRTDPLPGPVLLDMYDNGSVVTVGNLVQGAEVTITNGLGQEIGHGGATAGRHRYRVHPPLTDSDGIEVTQRLCDLVSAGKGVVRHCSDLPPARIVSPRSGDWHVHLVDVLADEWIRIFSVTTGEEIGDGGGEVIELTRQLEAGEVLLTTTALGDCTSRWSHRVEVGPPVGELGGTSERPGVRSGDVTRKGSLVGRQSTDAGDVWCWMDETPSWAFSDLPGTEIDVGYDKTYVRESLGCWERHAYNQVAYVEFRPHDPALEEVFQRLVEDDLLVRAELVLTKLSSENSWEVDQLVVGLKGDDWETGVHVRGEKLEDTGTGTPHPGRVRQIRFTDGAASTGEGGTLADVNDYDQFRIDITDSVLDAWRDSSMPNSVVISARSGAPYFGDVIDILFADHQYFKARFSARLVFEYRE